MENPYDPHFNFTSSKEDLIRDVEWLNNEVNRLTAENEDLRKACEYWQRAYNLSKPKQYEFSKWTDSPEIMDFYPGPIKQSWIQEELPFDYGKRG